MPQNNHAGTGETRLAGVAEAYAGIVSSLCQAEIPSLRENDAAEAAVDLLIKDAESMKTIAAEVGRWDDTSKDKVLTVLRRHVDQVEQCFTAILATDASIL